MCKQIRFSLRTSTYFWAFMHIFLGVVFLFACSLETFKYGRDETEQGIWIDVSTQIAGRKADLFIMWCYGILYFSCSMMLFHGCHKEVTTLIKCVLVIFIILEVCAAGLVKRLVNNKQQQSFFEDEDFFDVYFFVFQTNLVVFFLTVHIFSSIFYSINLFIYVYILQKSKAILHNVTYA